MLVSHAITIRIWPMAQMNLGVDKSRSLIDHIGHDIKVSSVQRFKEAVGKAEFLHCGCVSDSAGSLRAFGMILCGTLHADQRYNERVRVPVSRVCRVRDEVRARVISG